MQDAVKQNKTSHPINAFQLPLFFPATFCHSGKDDHPCGMFESPYQDGILPDTLIQICVTRALPVQ